MLRKRRLAYADGVDQVVDRKLTPQHQPAQDQQPVLVGEQLQQLRGFARFALEFGDAGIERRFAAAER